MCSRKTPKTLSCAKTSQLFDTLQLLTEERKKEEEISSVLKKNNTRNKQTSTICACAHAQLHTHTHTYRHTQCTHQTSAIPMQTCAYLEEGRLLTIQIKKTRQPFCIHVQWACTQAYLDNYSLSTHAHAHMHYHKPLLNTQGTLTHSNTLT